MKKQDIIALILCLAIGIGLWTYLSKPKETKTVLTHPRTIITETYFERDMKLNPEQFMELVNNFARKMESPGRKLTIKIYSDVNEGGIIGALLITEETNK